MISLESKLGIRIELDRDVHQRFPEPVEKGCELRPFIHHFPQRKQVLLKILSIITQAHEKINLFSP